MMCRFCKLEVDQPCQDVHEMRQRATNHVERCEKALKDDLGDEINPSDGESAGSI